MLRSSFPFYNQVIFSRLLDQSWLGDNIAAVGKNKGGVISGSYRRRGGLWYLEEEEVKIVNYIVARKAYDRVNESGLWIELEKEKILESRTARGMKSRFERVILTNIKTGKKSYGLPEQEISLFKKWGRKKKDVGEQEEEKKDKGAEIIANAKKGEKTSNGDPVDALKQHIEDHCLGLVFRECTKGDGNCWYRACADQVVLHNLPDLPRDHRALRLLVTSRIRSLPQYGGWLANYFGGNVEAFDQFLHFHSQDGAWTDAYGILCQATALILQRPIVVVGTNNENGFFILESVPSSENLPAFTIGHYYERHYQSLTTPLMEDRRKEEEKKENKKSKGSLQVDLRESLYFRKCPTAIATPQERSVKLFQNSLEGLPEGWKIRTLVVNKEKGTTQDH